MLEPSFNTWTVVFLVVAVQGFLLSVIFATRKKGRSLPNKLMALFLLLFSLVLVNYVAVWTNYLVEFPHLMGIAAPMYFLFGPVLYLYGITILKHQRDIKAIDFLHFLPFIVYFIWLLPIYFQSGAEKAIIIQNFLQSEWTLTELDKLIVFLESLHMSIYAGLILYTLKSISSSGNVFEGITKNKEAWLRTVTYCFIGFILSYVLFFVLLDLIGYSAKYDYPISFAMSGFIFTIGYLGFSKPEYLYEAHNGFKYERSSLNTKEAKRHLHKLLAFMEEEKPYTEGDLKLEDLSEEMGIPSHHLSQIINDGLNKNFSEFVNSYRVEEAKKMLSNPTKFDYKILRIAFESGFNNKVTFNSAFKKEVGMTPSQYRKRHMKKEKIG